MRSGAKISTFILCFCAISCGSLMVDKTTHDYPQASKDLFVSSCTNSGGNQQQCTCMLGKVQEKYTYGEMEELEQKIKSGQPPQDFTDFMTQATAACRTPGPGPTASKSVQPQ